MDHILTALEEVAGEWEWTCRCGEESTGYEDRDAAESDFDEHARTGNADAKEA